LNVLPEIDYEPGRNFRLTIDNKPTSHDETSARLSQSDAAWWCDRCAARWLAVLLVLKVLAHLEVFVKPVSSHLPHSLAHPRVIAILVLVGLCFLVGAAIQTAIGAKAERTAERLVLERIPGYTVLRSLASRLSDHAETASFQPALVEMEEALVPAFIVEQHSGNRCTFSFPQCPHPWLEPFIS
jgi:hypothetical protein